MKFRDFRDRLAGSQRKLPAQGLTHHRARRFAVSAAAYRLGLDSSPDNSEAKYLGVLRLQQGDVPTAIDMIQQAIANSADLASYDCNLAEVFRLAGQLD